MSSSAGKKELPRWVLPMVVVFGLAVLGLVGYRALTGVNAPEGKAIQVHPGMYDFRAEAAKGNIGRRSDRAGAPPGSQTGN